MFIPALHSPNQAEKWLRVWEMFQDWYRRLLRHTQLRIYVSTDDRSFAKHWRISEFKILY